MDMLRVSVVYAMTLQGLEKGTNQLGQLGVTSESDLTWHQADTYLPPPSRALDGPPPLKCPTDPGYNRLT